MHANEPSQNNDLKSNSDDTSAVTPEPAPEPAAPTTQAPPEPTVTADAAPTGSVTQEAALDTTKPEPTCKATDEEIKALHAEIGAMGKRTIAIAVTLGTLLEQKWADVGKGAFGAWLRLIGLPDSTANQYRNIFRKWRALTSNPKTKVVPQVVGVAAGGAPATATIPIPAKWVGMSFKNVAHGHDPDEPPPKPVKPLPSDVIELRWLGLADADIKVAGTNHHLNPLRLQADLLDVHAPLDLALRAAKPATEMLTSILYRLRDQGHWEAARNETLTGIRDLLQVLSTVDADGAMKVAEMLAGDDEDLDGLFDTAEAAATRERDRLMALAYEEEARDPARQESVVREVHDAMTWPMTTGEIGAEAAKTVGSTVAPERVKKALDGKPKWALDGHRWHPPHFDRIAVDEDDQKRIAKEHGWVDHIEERARRARIRENRRNNKVKAPVKGTGWVRRGDTVRLLSSAMTSTGQTVQAGAVGRVNYISGRNAQWVTARFDGGRDVSVGARDLGIKWEFADAATAKKRAGKRVPVKSDPKRRTSILIKYGGGWSRYWAPSVSAVYAALPAERFHVSSVAPPTKSPVPSGPNTMVITVDPPDDALRERVREVATAGIFAHVTKIEAGKAARKAERAATKVRDGLAEMKPSKAKETPSTKPTSKSLTEVSPTSKRKTS